MKKTFLYLLFALIGLSALQSCSKDDETTTTILDDNDKISLSINGNSDGIVMDISNLSTDAQADLSGASGILNVFAGTISLINNMPEDASPLKSASLEEKTYYWSIVLGDVTYEYWLMYAELDDRLTFSIDTKFTGVERYLLNDGFVTKDGKSGELTIYGMEGVSPTVFQLSILADGTTIVKGTSSDNHYSSYGKLNPDKSGEANFSAYDMSYSATWGANYTNIKVNKNY